jgi:Leucine-rich repeat (LRR) protein
MKASKAENIFEIKKRDLLTISQLTVSHFGVRSICSTLFTFTVIKLNLAQNNVKEIDEDVFFRDEVYFNSILDSLDNDEDSSHLKFLNFQTALESLSVRNNKIVCIEPGSFQFLVNLRFLDLSGGYLTRLGEQSFQGLVNLEELNLSNCFIELLDSNLFTELNKLKSLNLSRNQLHQIDENLFRSLLDLEELNMNWNYIGTIGTGTFENLAKLKKLLIGYNNLEFIHRETFTSLSSLEILDLKCNKIILASIEPACFEKLTKMTKLNLTSTGIAVSSEKSIGSDSIQFETFEGLGRLEELSLNNAKIVSIVPNSFFHVGVALKILDLRYNELFELDSRAFNWLLNLETLLLAGNRIRKLSEDTFIYLKKLKFLDLNDNQISEVIPAAFYGLNCLERLNLCGNRLEKIDSDTFASLVSLRFLDLSSNRLKTISHSMFNGLFLLRKLNLRGNFISVIEPGSFETLEKLRHLDLYENRLAEFHESLFDELASLSELDLASNPILNNLTRANKSDQTTNSVVHVVLTDIVTGIPYEIQV